MPDFFDWVSTGISTASQPVVNWLTDSRASNSSRPRIDTIDPTQAIDQANTLSILNFPHDRPKYYMTFAFEEYQRPNQFQGLQSSGLTDYIALPIPNNMRDNNTVDYSEQAGHILGETLSLMHENGSSAYDAYKTGGVGGLQDQIEKNVGDALSGGSQGATGWGINKIVQGLKSTESLAGEKGATDAALQVAGLADNPFMTIMLKGPKFKRHHFMWRLAPKSPAESDTVKNIIGTFKKMAYPELLTLGTGGFFKYPRICWPKFQPDGVIDYTYAFKPCVITAFNFMHTPNDRPGFFTTNATIEIVFELSLIEIELWRGGEGESFTNGNLPTVQGDFNSVPNVPVKL